jgi:hypothetical protein
VDGLEHIQSASARFLADGQHLVTNANVPTHATRCYVLDLAGGKPRAVTPEGTVCGPSSPDGRFVIAIRPNSDVAVYPVDGGTPRLIPRLDPAFHPVQWSKDGSLLYGYRMGELPSNIYKVEIATGKQSVLQELRPAVPAGVVIVAPVVVSRDGTRFLYSYNQALSVLYLISGLH